ncbi:GrpE-domain-containing protein, partial [Metschnikowia bicuspidata]
TSLAAFRVVSAVRFNSTKPAEAESSKAESATAAEAEKPEESQAAPEEKSTEEILLEKLAKTEKALAEKDRALAEMKNHYAQAVTNFRNLQHVSAQEIQKAKDFALQKFANDLLETLDNFSLALGSVKEETLKANEEVRNLFDGVSMTRNILEKSLEKHGVEKIDPIGQQFDPNHHEATFEVPQPDKEPGTVFHVQQLGYTLNRRVLRPAKVGLVKDAE